MSVTTASFVYDRISRATVEPTLDSEGSVTMELIVRKLSGQILNPDSIKLMRTESIIPYNGVLFPGGLDATWENTARFRSYSAEFIEGGAALRIGLRWTTRYVVEPVEVLNVHNLVLPLSTDYSVRARSLALFRTGWATAPPAASDTTSADIGGTTITGADQGISLQVPQVAIRLRFMQDASATPMSNAAAALSNYIGTRNSATFLSFAANAMICEGVSVTDAGDEYYEVVFEFLYDRYYHHEQVPQYDVDGKPARTSTGLLRVDWKRAPRTSTDFNNIFSADARLKLRAEKGWWL